MAGLFLSSASAQEPLTGAFTYQGRLNATEGFPASGDYDLQFGLYDAEIGGNQINGTTVSLTADVDGGLFSVSLDFGPGAFSGSRRWLEIQARPADSGAYIALAPRTEVTPAPHAGFAVDAGSAVTAVTADIATVADTTTHLGPFPASAFSPFAWQAITTDTQALPNTGYTVDSASQVRVTLPVSPAVGDLVRINGSGPGGWSIAQNPGQRIITSSLGIRKQGAQENWSVREGNRFWSSVASSDDGLRLVATARGGMIYTSDDGGFAWYPRDSNRGWQSVASSADGTRLVACVHGGYLYTSSDAGLTWTARETGTARWWRGVASSADGTRLIACVSGGQIYVSTDAGVTWSTRASTLNWEAVASSADGTRLVACVMGGQIYTSTDSGINWFARETNRDWSSVASSSDGTRLVACEVGFIYTSADSGVTWIPRELSGLWRSVASSADGTRLVACAHNQPLRTSRDGGETWTAHDTVQSWSAVASSGDGTRLIACINSGLLYTSIELPLLQTTTGSAGALIGTQHSAIELQYIGNDTFLPLSSVGVLQGK